MLSARKTAGADNMLASYLPLEREASLYRHSHLLLRITVVSDSQHERLGSGVDIWHDRNNLKHTRNLEFARTGIADFRGHAVDGQRDRGGRRGDDDTLIVLPAVQQDAAIGDVQLTATVLPGPYPGAGSQEEPAGAGLSSLFGVPLSSTRSIPADMTPRLRIRLWPVPSPLTVKIPGDVSRSGTVTVGEATPLWMTATSTVGFPASA